MIKTILIDDERMALEQLKYIVEQYEDIELIKSFSDPIEALQEFKDIKPDLVFLDISMPGLNGFMVAEEIKNISPKTEIVFVTGYDDYAIQAFELNAMDYILKPISKSRVDKTIKRVIDAISIPKLRNQGDNLSYKNLNVLSKDVNLTFRRSIEKIPVWEGDNIVLLNLPDILFFTYSNRSAVAVTKDKEYKTRHSMDYWEERLTKFNYFRCYRSYLINLDKIEKISVVFNNAYSLKIAGYPEHIPVSRKNMMLIKRILDLD